MAPAAAARRAPYALLVAALLVAACAPRCAADGDELLVRQGEALAVQSSTFVGNSTSNVPYDRLAGAGPIFAIDGYGGWSDGLCSSTAGTEVAPWLYVDVGFPDIVFAVEITTREDKGGLHDIQIRVGNTLPTQGLAGDQALTTNALCGTYAGPSAAGDIVRVNCSAPLAGRYVSLQVVGGSVPADNVLQVCELQLYGNRTARPPLPTQNIATNQPAGQSSTSNNTGPGFSASAAVDDNTDGNCTVTPCAITGGDDENPFWWVDVGQDSAVQQIVIYNRIDCCAFQLQYLIARLSDSVPSPPVPGALLTAGSLCGMFAGSAAGVPDVQDVMTITCQGVGRYLSLQRLSFAFEVPGQRFMALPEVQVLGQTYTRPTSPSPPPPKPRPPPRPPPPRPRPPPPPPSPRPPTPPPPYIPLVSLVRQGETIAVQSSTYRGTNSVDVPYSLSGADAILAIDGVPGPWSSRTCSATSGTETYPYLFLDFGRADTVYKVEFTTRNDIGGLHDVQVRVGGILPSTTPTLNPLCGIFVGPSTPGQVVTLWCNTPLQGRYLSLQVVGGSNVALNKLQICELKVQGLRAARPPTTGDVISIDRPATMSSSLTANFGPAGAVDNTTSPACSDPLSCAITSIGAPNPWLLLDLGTGVTVAGLKLFSRGTAPQRLADLQFRLGATKPTPGAGELITANRLCAVLPGRLPAGQQTADVACAGGGRWLSVQRLSRGGDDDSRVLQLAELQVLGVLPPLDCPNRGQLSCIAPGFTLPNPLATLNGTRLTFRDPRNGQRRDLLQLLSINSVINWISDKVPWDITRCAFPIFRGQQVIDYGQNPPTWQAISGIAGLFEACQNAPMNPTSSYLFGVLPNLASFIPVGADLVGLKETLSAVMPEFSVCLALNPCLPTDFDLLVGFIGVQVDIPVTPFTFSFGLDAFGFSKRGTLVPPTQVGDAPRTLWTPVIGTLQPGSVAPIPTTGNVYLAGSMSFGFGVSKVVTLTMDGSAWLLIRYLTPAEFVFAVETGPSVTLWDKITLDLKGLNQINADVRFRGTPSSLEFWLALTKRMDLKTLVAGIPAVGDKLADMMPASVYMELRLDLYFNTQPPRAGAAVRITFELGVVLQGRAADVATSVLGSPSLPSGFSMIAQADFGDGNFNIIFQLRLLGQNRTLAIPFCDTDDDCLGDKVCQLFVCGNKLPRGGPCTRNAQCQSGRCGTSRGLLFCVECTSDSHCPSGQSCDMTTFWDPTVLYTCRSFNSCRKRLDGFGTSCKPGYEPIAGGTTCRQLCWGSLSKSCGAFCTQASRSCTGIDGGVVKACPRQEFTNGDEVCLRKVLTVAVPDSKLTINVADNGLIKGTASYCPDGTTPISSGLNQAGQLRVQCVAACPTNYYTIPCGGYCGLNADVACPPDPTRIQGDVAACEDLQRVAGFVTLQSATSWGSWGGYNVCPGGRSVTGFSIKLEDKQGSGVLNDDTAMNGVKMQCPGGQIISATNDGPSGTWRSWAFCPAGQRFVGGRLRSEKPQGGGDNDDTAINSLTMRCTDGSERTSHPGWWGDQKAWGLCPSGTFVCGFRQRVESGQGPVGDDTALNSIQLLCCPPA